MDRSFSVGMRPAKNTNVSRSRQSLAGSFFAGPSGGGRSNNTTNFTRQGSGRYSLSSRLNVSKQDVVAKSEYNVLETYGLVLPVQVTNMLSYSDRNIPVSVNYSQNGWAWLVQGRRLFVWQFSENPIQKSTSGGGGGFTKESISKIARKVGSQIRELTLPHCDIGHKATLVSVFVCEGQPMAGASCMAVSPAGDVRYWQSILHDGSSIDESNILEGQEFEQLVSLGGCEFILATTTCSLVRLSVDLQQGHSSIQARLMKPPSGFLGSIGKRFASIIIGMHNNQERENKLVKITCEKMSANEWHVTVLADRWIQRWALQPNSKTERFLSEDVEIVKKMRDFFHQKLWSTRDASEIEQWPLDMQPTDRGVIVLSAAANHQRSPQVQYALMTFVFEPNHTFTLTESTLLRYQGLYNPERVTDDMDFRFIANRSFAYVYNERFILPVALSSGPVASTESVEKIEFSTHDNAILMGNCFQNLPLFFTRMNGVVIVTPSDFDPSDMFNSSFSSDVFSSNVSGAADMSAMKQSMFAPSAINAGNLVLYELDPDELTESFATEPDDPVHLLKAAFIYHVKRNTTMADELVQSLLETTSQREHVDGVLDRTVLKIAIDLADDTPAADPRWEVTDRHALGSSTSMQIVQQLREKNVAYTLFIEFLHGRGLWEHLGAVSGTTTNTGEIHTTAQCLSDIGEKIVAAIGLRCLHSGHARLLDEAISLVLRQSNRSVPFPNLIPQDLFYAQTSRVEELFHVLAELVDRYVKEERSPIQIQSALVEVNTIILAVLQEVLKYRETKVEMFTVQEELSKRYEYVPWTAAAGKRGLRDVLSHMVSTTLREGIKGTAEPEFRAKHFTHMTELVDYVLDGRKAYLEHIHDPDKYDVLLQQYKAQRSDLIYPFLEAEQYEMAAKLAEKYLDFQALVEICDKTNNQERLDEYIERYREHDFAQFAISWHMRQCKQGNILQRFKNNPSELGRFLVDHPSMAWIQLVFNGELLQAAKVLGALAARELELLARKRVILCLAKLCLLASDGETHGPLLDELNSELDLIEIQENIPPELLEHFGYDSKDVKVLTPDEMVNLFIADVSGISSEKEFHHALTLLPYFANPDEVRQRIWCAASGATQYAVLQADRSVLHLGRWTAGEFLPPLEYFLEAPELGELTDSKSFQYLMRLGYEHIHESYQTN
ncbi:AGAP003503-PA-like protein [Anopheles sinensis]|uniref:AGAP003503-PA-like protein n=2 Tax=Anopheles sinensis TaxID=74873 RepID=A0A084VDU6_ANOSI|nr:AGAP003503-PA-like protein [Anopheles sinensis]